VRIAIIGSGNVGTALAKSLLHAGHEVTFGVRDPDPAKPNEASIAQASAGAEVVILAIPFEAAAQTVHAAAGFAGKILIDASNPLGMVEGGLGLTMGFETSGAERIAELAPRARVFKSFNQTGFENMADPGAYAARPVMFVAGDEPDGKAKVLSLVADVGFEPVDAGGLRASRLLEPFGMLWIELVRKRKFRPFVFSLQYRN
jgi:predicted dinucleotide-binding enzyme